MMDKTTKNGYGGEEEFDQFLRPHEENTDYSNEKRQDRFLDRLKSDKEFRHKILHTAVVCWSFIVLGWAAGMGGPTFPDIRQILQKDLATSSWIFTVGAIGYVTGSLVFGVLYDKLNKLVLLAISTFGFAVFQCAQPWCVMFPVMLVDRFFGGAFAGGLDTGGNADIPYIWGTESGPYMQALHLCFCLGAILSPLATEPFLAKKICLLSNNGTENVTQSGISVTPESQNDPRGTVSPCTDIYEDTIVHYAFLISAILILSATVGYIFLYCKMSHVHANLAKQQQTSKENDSGKDLELSGQRMPFKVKAAFLSLLAALMMSYCVMEDGFASFLMTFSLSYLGWDKETGSYVTTVFWAVFVIGRFSGIFLVSRFKQKTLLTTYFLLITLSLVGFLLAAVFRIIPLIWIFTGTLGFSMSVVFPCIFGWTSENIMQITGKISAMFLVSAGIGAMIFPLLVGYLMEFHSPMWFIYMLVITMVFTLTVYSSIRLIARICVHKKAKKEQNVKFGKETTVVKSTKVKVDEDHNLYPILR